MRRSKIKLLFCLFLSFWTISVTAEEVVVPHLEAHRAHLSAIENYFFDPEVKGAGYTQVPPADLKYRQTRGDLDGLIGQLKTSTMPSSHNLDKMLLYIFEVDPEKYNQNVTIFNFNEPSEYSAVVMRLSKDKILNLSREVFLFILGHELGHGYANLQKRYYLLDENLDFKLSRFTSEELAGNPDLKPLYDLIHKAGFSKPTGKVAVWLYDSELSMILKSIKISFLTKADREQIKKGIPESIVNIIPDSYDRAEGEYMISPEDSYMVDKINKFYRDLGKNHPKLKNISFDDFVSHFKIDELRVAQYEELLLIAEQRKDSLSGEFSKKSMITIIFDAADLYHRRYIEKKAALEMFLPRIRFYSSENIADETSFKLLRAQGIGFEVYGRGLLQFADITTNEIDKCFNEYVDKDVEPPIGALSDEHPASCWRMYSLKKLQDYFQN